MIIPSRKKCDKGHNLEYYHHAGDEWVLWCPKCHKFGYYKQNVFRWRLLSRVDDFLNDLTWHEWVNRYLRARHKLGRIIYGRESFDNLFEEADKYSQWKRKIKMGKLRKSRNVEFKKNA